MTAALLLLTALLVGVGRAQVGPRLNAPLPWDAGEWRVAGTLPVWLDRIDRDTDTYVRDGLLYTGAGIDTAVAPFEALALRASIIGAFSPVGTDDFAPPMWHGVASARIVAPGRAVQVGGFLTTTRLGTRSHPSDRWPLHRVDAYGGLALLFPGEEGRARGDLHLSVLQCGFTYRTEGWDPPFCPLAPPWEEAGGIWFAYSLMTSEVGVDFALGDRDWLRLGLTNVSPTVGWKRQWDRLDLTVRASTTFFALNAVEVQLGWGPRREPPEER